MSANINNRSEEFFGYSSPSKIGKVIGLISNLSVPVYLIILGLVITAAIVTKSIII